MTENRKIKNATASQVETGEGTIKMKSKLEEKVYETLSSLGLCPKYEALTFTLFDSFTSQTPFFDRETKVQQLRNGHAARMLVQKNSKIIGIRYTPDFYIRYKDLDVYIEAKGMENDVFYIKKKLFIKYLDNVLERTGQKSLYFEVYTITQLLQAVEIIKQSE